MSISKWRKYGLWKLRSILNFLENSDALIYEVRDQSGKFKYPFYTEQYLHAYLTEEYEIVVLDKEKYLKEFRERIKTMEDEK